MLGGLSMPSSCRRGSIVLELFERYYERVYLFARRSVDPALAEDIAQEVFVRMLSVRDLEGKEISISYLLKVADNLIKRSHRRRRRLESFIEREAQESGGPGRNEAAHTASSIAEPAPLDRAAETLSRGERDALAMIVCRGMSYEEAARSLDVKVSTVNNWKFRGIQKLRQSPALLDERAPERPGDRAAERGDRPRDRADAVARSRSGAGQRAG